MNATELRSVAREHKLEPLLGQVVAGAPGASEKLAGKLATLGAGTLDAKSLRALAEAALSQHEDAAALVGQKTATLRKNIEGNGAITSITGGNTPSIIALRTKTAVDAKDVSKHALVEGPEAIAAWKAALTTPPSRTVEYDAKKAFLPKVGTFGTVAESDWRQEMITVFKLLLDKVKPGDAVGRAAAAEMVFNPQLPPGQWKPEFAQEEALHLLKDKVVIFGLAHEYASVGSMAEIGFIAALSFLRSRKTIAFIKDTGPDVGADAQRARGQVMADARYIASMVPESFTFSQNQLEAIEQSFHEQMRFGKFLSSPVSSQVAMRFMPRDDIERRVVVSGSSKDPDSIERLQLKTALKSAGAPFVDTWRADWTLEKYESEEIPLKDRSLVNCVMVSDTTSNGALKDVGLAVFRALANGSYAVISLPEDAANPKSDYSRARALVVAHWQRLSDEFPWAKHFVKFVDTPAAMADAAASIIKDAPVSA